MKYTITILYLCMFARVSFCMVQFRTISKNWLGQAVVAAGLAFQFNPIAPALADAIPLVGARAPDFNLPSTLGKDISLKDLAGKRTVLYFYPVQNAKY